MMLNHRNSDLSGRQYLRNGEFNQLLGECAFSKRQLALAVGVHPNTVSAWSTGAREVPGAVLAYLNLYARVRGLL